MFRIMRLQFLECRIRRPVQEVLQELRMVVPDLELGPILCQRHPARSVLPTIVTEKGDSPDHLNIHPVPLSRRRIADVERITVKQ